MATDKAKIFGIGLSKTGTTSLANALQILGYKTKDNMGVVKYAAGELSSVDLAVVDAHDALTDTPIPSFYRELDARYPGSKFILTVRDSEGWSKSCKKQFTQRDAQRQNEAHQRLFIDLYGTDVFDEQGFANGYQRFVNGVRDYFKDRPQDLLTIEISKGEGWERLCQFLGRPVPDIPFPKSNVTQIRWMNIDDIVAVATQAGAGLMSRFEGQGSSNASGNINAHSRARIARRLYDAAVRALLREDALQMAIRRAHKAIAAGLTKLSPEIPLVSRASGVAPYGERRRWNHCWLVDPLDGEEAFGRGSNDFSVNIALIEDGRPIYGVVRAPALDITYYGQAGKGGYRRKDGEAPVPLDADQDPAHLVQAAGGCLEPSMATEQYQPGASRALAIFALANAKRSGESMLRPSMEWHTAAADAILRCAGRRICDDESGEELDYNKKDLANGAAKIT